MPYIPYWFESFEPCFSWIVPAIALASLWGAKFTDDSRIQKIAERCFFAAMLVVAAATLRTVMVDDGCWLLHMTSLGIMVLGATFPQPEITSEYECDVALTDY